MKKLCYNCKHFKYREYYDVTAFSKVLEGECQNRYTPEDKRTFERCYVEKKRNHLNRTINYGMNGCCINFEGS